MDISKTCQNKFQEHNLSSRELSSGTVLESNATLSRTTISESKIYPKAKVENLIDKNQDVSSLQKRIDLHLTEHVDTSLYQTSIRKDVSQRKLNLESQNEQTVSLIEINSKPISKRKISSESLDRNMLPTKVRIKNKIKIDSVIPSEIKSDNLHDFTISIDKDIIYNTISNEKTEDTAIRKNQSNTFVDNSQKHIESTNFDNSCDCITCIKKYNSMYDIIIKKKAKDASTGKRDTFVDNSRENIQSTNSDNLCHSTACTKKYDYMHVATDERIQDGPLIYERGTLIKDSQENTKLVTYLGANSKTSSDLSQCIEKYYDVDDAPQSALLQTAPLQSISQLVSEQPLHNITVKQVPSKANASVKLNTANINHLPYIEQILIRQICNNVTQCRDIQNKIFFIGLQMEASAKYIQRLCINIKQITEDLQELKVRLCTNDVQCAITYVNQYKRLSQPMTLMEINNYIVLIQSYMFYGTQISDKDNVKFDASQCPNTSGSVPNASMPNVNASQPFSKRKTRVSNHDRSMQSSLHPVSTLSNVNQQQFFGNSANSVQVPHLIQSKLNICQQYMGYVPSTGHTYMPHANQQQFFENTSYPVQGQYMPSANRSTVVHQASINTNKVSSSNINMGSYKPINQGNAYLPPATNMRSMSHTTLKNTINNSAAAFALNAQQQKQMYSQKLQMNSGTAVYSPPTDQNLLPRIRQTVLDVTGFNTTNFDAPKNDAVMENVRHRDANVNLRYEQACCSQQVSQASLQYLYQNELNKNYVPVSQFAHRNVQTHSVQNIRPHQNVQPQLRRSQHLMQFQKVPNKEAEILELQNKHPGQNKLSSMNSQQEILIAYNVSQNRSDTVSNNSTSQKTNSLQNTLCKISSQNLDLPQSIALLLQRKEALGYNFNLKILTVKQKILLCEQIKSYFLMLDHMNLLNKQECKQIFDERSMLLYLFWCLHDYNQNLPDIIKKCDKRDLQDNTSQNKSVTEEKAMQISVDELTKIQSSRDNENNSTSNRNLEKQSSEQAINLSISKNSKPTVIKSNLEARKEESLFTPEFATTRELFTKDIRLQEQNNTLQKGFQKCLLVDTEKRPDNAESSLPGHLRAPEKNSIIRMSAKSSETEAQDNTKINESLITSSRGHLRTPEENSITRMSGKISETEAQDNTKINESLITSSSRHLRTPEENSIAEISAKNFEMETQDNAKINEPLQTTSPEHLRISEENSITEVFTKNVVIEMQVNEKIHESLKAINLYDKQLPEWYPLVQNLVKLLQEVTKNTKDQAEISESNANKKFNIVITESCNETSNVATLNNNGRTNATLSPYNTEDQNERVYNPSNKIPSENLQDGMCDDVNDNIEILTVTEIQSDRLNTSHDSVPASSNSIQQSLSSITKSTKISEVFTLNAQQKDSTNEQSKNFTEETSETFGKQRLDENGEELQRQEQCDKISFTEERNLKMLQNSARPFTKMPLSLLKNMVEGADTFKDFVTKAQNAELNEELLEAKNIISEEISLEFENEWNVGENMILPTDIIRKVEDRKEEGIEQVLLEEKEMCEEMSLKFEISKDSSSIEENTVEYILGLPENTEEEKMKINTHNNIKTINEQFKYVSKEKYYEKSQLSSCNSIQKDDPIDINVEVFAKNNILNNVECISVKSDSEVMIMPNILNIRSISSTLFEKIENTNTFPQSDLESLNENDEKSLDYINVNRETSGDVDDRPCLRCRRKSTVYCKACLEAHYCSKRCSSLHWKADHHKKCKGRDTILCVNIV